MNNLQKKWQTLASQYANTTLVSEVWELIKNNYTHKKRYYHNLNHLEAMFTHLEVVKHNITDIATIQFAIWFHDIIYKPTKKDNEIQSALVAKKVLFQFTLDANQIHTIEQLILSTQKHNIILNKNNDNAYLLDLDLSILGSNWNNYQEYTKNVREEYSMFPDFIYKPNRKKILQKFLKKDNLYFTLVFRNKFETIARENISKEINLM